MSKSFNKIMGIAFITVALALAVSVGMPVGAMAADTIKIGQIDPFSGPFPF